MRGSDTVSELGGGSDVSAALVLVLSNRQHVFESLATSLADLGAAVEVHVAHTPERLVACVNDLRPDALVVDWDGLDAEEQRQVLAAGLLELLPSIVLAASPTQQTRDRFAEAGVLDVVSYDRTYLHHVGRAVRRAWRVSGMQARLEETKQHYRDILEASGDGIFVLVDGTFRYVNQAFARILGLAVEDVAGQMRLVDCVVLGERRAVGEELARIECGGELRELVEMTLAGNVDSPRRVEVTCRASLVDGQRAVVGVARDVTALSELQEEVESARQRAAQIERLRALGELAAGVAHNFNNALGAIIGRVALARERLRRQEDIAHDLAIIDSAARDAALTVQRIQGFARPSGGDAWTVLDVQALAQSAAEYVRARLTSGARLLLDLAATPSTRGNSAEIREVIVNLLNNAVDAVASHGDVRLVAGEEHGYAFVRVEDDGPGMSSDVRQRIFEPFFTTKGAAGTGLGLSVSHDILRRHDATLHVASEPGQGTVFKILFPVVETVNARTPASQPVVEALSIVIVEEDAAAGDAFRNLLGAWGYHTVVADNAREAARLVASSRVDLVFADLDLPGMSGWQLARKLREIQPRLLIGLITAWPLTASAEELRARGVDFLLRKPFTSDSLTRILERVKRGETPPTHH